MSTRMIETVEIFFVRVIIHFTCLAVGIVKYYALCRVGNCWNFTPQTHMLGSIKINTSDDDGRWWENSSGDRKLRV